MCTYHFILMASNICKKFVFSTIVMIKKELKLLVRSQILCLKYVWYLGICMGYNIGPIN